MAAQPLRKQGFGLTDPTSIADIALGCSLAQCIEFVGAHAPTRHLQDHWRSLPPVTVSGPDAELEPPLLQLDHTETSCTIDYTDALTRVWDMVPKYLTDAYDNMAAIAKSDTFTTSLLTDLNKLQNLMSDGRHRNVLKSLKHHIHIDVPRGNDSTAAERTHRHEALQLGHIITAAEEGPFGSHTGALLNLLPLHPGHIISNAAFRLFTISMLRLWPDTTSYPRPYCEKCSLCNNTMFNYHVHALGACPKIAKSRRHDMCLDPFVDLIKRLGCDMPHKEPPGTDPDCNTRPDIEFRKSNTSVTCGYDVVKIGDRNCADLTVVSLNKNLVIDHMSPPEAERPWIPARKDKENKHSVGSHKCLPLVSTVLGALDPDFTRWLMEVVNSLPDENKIGRSVLRKFYIKFQTTLWTHNCYMYDKYISRLGSVEGISDASLPPRL